LKITKIINIIVRIEIQTILNEEFSNASELYSLQLQNHIYGCFVLMEFIAEKKWDLSEAEFAKALKRVCFNDKPVLFTGKGREPEGYLFNGIYWTPLALHNAELKQLHFDNLYNYYTEELDNVQSDIDEKTYKNLLNTIKTLNTNKTRENIIKIFKSDNYVEDVEWNKHINLFVFDDCIYDLYKGEFVDAKAEDYINLSCGYNYELEDFENIETVKEDIIKIFKSIVKNEDISSILDRSFLFVCSMRPLILS
jgi:hypothetical protein